eukprot:scaffold167657_cov48-Prasinocladus_malaysianus.AAC.2
MYPWTLIYETTGWSRFGSSVYPPRTNARTTDMHHAPCLLWPSGRPRRSYDLALIPVDLDALESAATGSSSS